MEREREEEEVRLPGWVLLEDHDDVGGGYGGDGSGGAFDEGRGRDGEGEEGEEEDGEEVELSEEHGACGRSGDVLEKLLPKLVKRKKKCTHVGFQPAFISIFGLFSWAMGITEGRWRGGHHQLVLLHSRTVSRLPSLVYPSIHPASLEPRCFS